MSNAAKTDVARNYLTQTRAAAETVAAMGGPSKEYHRKIWAAADMALLAYALEGEPGVRELVASLHRTDADRVLLAEAVRLHRAVQVRI